MFYNCNIEGITEYNIPEAGNRKPGISAMLRLANEAQFIRPCVLSILPFVDEVACFLQDSTDDTETILQSIESDKIVIRHYPFKSLPNGPGHKDQPRGSVYERAYFYNWCLAHTSHEWVSKWDGDMIALSWLSHGIPYAMQSFDAVKFPGVNLVSLDPPMESMTQPKAPPDVRFFRACLGHYVTGPMSERLSLDSPSILEIPHVGYVHMKFMKDAESRRKAWPPDWESISHFKKIEDRALPGSVYRGEIPAELENTCAV
jgi:hypothetical protein